MSDSKNAAPEQPCLPGLGPEVCKHRNLTPSNDDRSEAMDRETFLVSLKDSCQGCPLFRPTCTVRLGIAQFKTEEGN